MTARFGGVLAVLDTVILTIFVVELLLRMAVLGTRFWRDPWCLFDFVVVVVTLVPATGNLSIFRALRILRAMRLISAVKSVRRVVGSLLSAIPIMGAVIFLLLLIRSLSSTCSSESLSMPCSTRPTRSASVSSR